MNEFIRGKWKEGLFTYIGFSSRLDTYTGTKNSTVQGNVGEELYKRIGEWKKVPGVEKTIPFAVGQRVLTRDGRSVRIISVDRSYDSAECYSAYSIVALVKNRNNKGELIFCYLPTGAASVGMECPQDIIPLTEKMPDTVQLVLDEGGEG